MSPSSTRRPLEPFVSFVLLLAALAPCACGGRETPSVVAEAPASAPPRGGTLVIGSTSDVDSWNPYVSQQAFAQTLLRRIYLRLAREEGDERTGPQRWAPSLAESWQASDDGLAVTFRIAEASWSDGRPIGAEDVRFSWQAQTSSDVPWVGAASKQAIRDVEVVDPRTVTFHFTERSPYQLADALEGVVLPAHVFRDVPFERWASHDWSAVRVASGPFRLERHEPGHEIVLLRNDAYRREERPLLDRVVVRIVPDSTSLATQLLTGELDYVEGLAPLEAERLRQRGAIELIAFDAPRYDFIGWNARRPPFDDPALRRAMTLAIDREALVSELLRGRGRVSRGPVLSHWWGADPTLEPWPHDPDEARRLLARAGYATLGDRALQAGSGRMLEIELLTNAGNALREDVLVKLQEQLARIGVRVHVRPLEMRALRQRAAAGDYDGFLGGWAFQGKVDLESIFGSAAAPPQGLNVVGYASPDVDRALGELARAADWRAMTPALHAIQQRIHHDQPYTFLYETQRLAAHGPRLGGLVVDVPSDPLAGLEDAWIRGR